MSSTVWVVDGDGRRREALMDQVEALGFHVVGCGTWSELSQADEGFALVDLSGLRGERDVRYLSRALRTLTPIGLVEPGQDEPSLLASIDLGLADMMPFDTPPHLVGQLLRSLGARCREDTAEPLDAASSDGPPLSDPPEATGPPRTHARSSGCNEAGCAFGTTPDEEAGIANPRPMLMEWNRIDDADRELLRAVTAPRPHGQPRVGAYPQTVLVSSVHAAGKPMHWFDAPEQWLSEGASLVVHRTLSRHCRADDGVVYLGEGRWACWLLGCPADAAEVVSGRLQQALSPRGEAGAIPELRMHVGSSTFDGPQAVPEAVLSEAEAARRCAEEAGVRFVRHKAEL